MKNEKQHILVADDDLTEVLLDGGRRNQESFADVRIMSAVSLVFGFANALL